MVERLLWEQEVARSNRVAPTKGSYTLYVSRGLLERISVTAKNSSIAESDRYIDRMLNGIAFDVYIDRSCR